MTYRRKIAAFALLLPVITPLLFAGIFQVLQNRIQHEMKERLEKDILHSTTLIKKNIRWAKNKKEAIIDGKYFDVKSFTDNKDGTITLTGLFDDEETTLTQQLQQNTQQQNNEAARLVVQALQLNIVFHQQASLNNFDNNKPKELYYNFNESIPAEIFTGCLTPPPKA